MAGLDCTACGACCTAEVYSGGGPFVTLYGPDADRFGPSELAPDAEGCDFLAVARAGAAEVRCAFLRGTVGVGCACTAYDRRPQVCRDLEAGSDACLAARAIKFGAPDPQTML
jgi:Fe-S-cluster containining protein